MEQGAIAEALDRLDGKNDNYLWAKRGNYEK